MTHKQHCYKHFIYRIRGRIKRDASTSQIKELSDSLESAPGISFKGNKLKKASIDNIPFFAVYDTQLHTVKTVYPLSFLSDEALKEAVDNGLLLKEEAMQELYKECSKEMEKRGTLITMEEYGALCESLKDKAPIAITPTGTELKYFKKNNEGFICKWSPSLELITTVGPDKGFYKELREAVEMPWWKKFYKRIRKWMDVSFLIAVH